MGLRYMLKTKYIKKFKYYRSINKDIQIMKNMSVWNVQKKLEWIIIHPLVQWDIGFKTVCISASTDDQTPFINDIVLHVTYASLRYL